MSTPDIEILLVEDNPDDEQLTLHALSKHLLANRVLVVRDGAEALACLGNLATVKVILLDLKLPKVSGLEVLKAIKNHPQIKTVPVVVLTSSREEPDIAAAYELGANSYIVKPVDFEQFVSAVSSTGLYWLRFNEVHRP